MRLSDAILMGRNLVKPCAWPTETQESNGGGCALTMAVVAVGGKADATGCVWVTALSLWPWLKGNSEDIAMDIIRKFDWQVMRGRMTFEQFVDYVRSIEPAEEAEKLPEPTADDGYYDEAPWSDSDTERERQNAIKGR